ncbi:uncharacterized protein SPPG_08503 [Spizellomyces punctatus DAOM BR117]|uniref:C3H1-type domain-containing protein n=1 Tax=Spizellomyces punctatus (strain DAOM BR117) TaxID=645134 RepID=A0A0L0H581_SPIPD|nr:uncharacterized protein SPPG_08503 [Spizellomyces punctatus DAOM BR117]KNC96114.1 hypothetical protein SPPG_08503 [Spizellomyces punctatus DAOM BR117]|eukprot:XP_016604154.1 hypothetical protein SPPG_08503 [Spizellomyces punctatus DAOM BR117]
MAAQGAINDGATVLTPSHSTSVSALCVWEDKLYSAGKDKDIREWDISSLALLRTFKGHTGWIRALVAGPFYLFSGSWDDTVRIWSLETGVCAFVLSCPSANALYYEPATLRLYSGGGYSRVVCEWDVSTGVLTGEMEPRDQQIGGTVGCMVGDGVRLFVGMTDGAISLYNLDTGTGMGFFDGHAAEVTSIVLLDEKCYSSGNDRRILEWDVPTGQLLRRFEGHEAFVSALAVVPPPVSDSESHDSGPLNGQAEADAHEGKLISGAWDGTVRVWDLVTGTAEGYLKAHRLSINALVNVNDKLFTADAEGAIKSWNLESIPAPPPHLDAVAISMTPPPARHLFNPYVFPPPMPPYYQALPPHMMYTQHPSQASGPSTTNAPQFRPRPPPQGGQICTFFLQGRCRFGDACRNIHPPPVVDANGMGMAL